MVCLCIYRIDVVIYVSGYGKLCHVVRAVGRCNLSVLFVARMYNDYGEEMIGGSHLYFSTKIQVKKFKM